MRRAPRDHRYEKAALFWYTDWVSEVYYRLSLFLANQSRNPQVPLKQLLVCTGFLQRRLNNPGYPWLAPASVTQCCISDGYQSTDPQSTIALTVRPCTKELFETMRRCAAVKRRLAISQLSDIENIVVTGLDVTFNAAKVDGFEPRVRTRNYNQYTL